MDGIITKSKESNLFAYNKAKIQDLLFNLILFQVSRVIFIMEWYLNFLEIKVHMIKSLLSTLAETQVRFSFSISIVKEA
jgi:hypothetical protein